nr:RNA-guided endonuclease TnpB family protein [Herbidospora mongoliensis]
MALLEHCRHARFVWNLAVEQSSYWRPGRGSTPGYSEQCRQLTEARAEFGWLKAGSAVVQQQALKDFAQAMTRFFDKINGRPNYRKCGKSEGFRIVGVKPGDIHRLSRNVGRVKIPKVGWIRFRWSRAIPPGVKSYRVNRDRAGRWHVAFSAIPAPIPAPGTGEVVGVDRGVVVAAALSTGEMLHAPMLREHEKTRLLRLQRTLARAARGSRRRDTVKSAIARLRAREADRRKDWVEKTSTSLARRFDVIGVEDLKVAKMTRSARGSIETPGKTFDRSPVSTEEFWLQVGACSSLGLSTRLQVGLSRSIRASRHRPATPARASPGGVARAKPSYNASPAGIGSMRT